MTEELKTPISTDNEWTLELIDEWYDEIERIATEWLGLDIYPNQIEIINSEQMLDAYASIAMPVLYKHWSFGKEFVRNLDNYKRGRMGLAFEVVINSNPCIAYCMEENSMLMQILVIAHASFGHNAFFKNNYLFTQWTDAESIIDYLTFARDYISECEERYGEEKVEEVIDACHALMGQGVDRYKRPRKLSFHEEKQKQKERNEYINSRINELWSTIPGYSMEYGRSSDLEEESNKFPKESQENILRFIEENAPLLEAWQREIVRIIRNVAQYFYPQKQTGVINEGFATFTHYTILNKMFDEGLLPNTYMFEFLVTHNNVVYQPAGSQINIYALGFTIFQEIKRVSTEPTDEDYEWFRHAEWVGRGDWMNMTQWAMQNFRDESFIRQFLTPKAIREMGFISLYDEAEQDYIEVTAIHDRRGYRYVRDTIADMFTLAKREPDIQVHNVNINDDRSIELVHYSHDGVLLDEQDAQRVLEHVMYLWGFDVTLITVDAYTNNKMMSMTIDKNGFGQYAEFV